MKKEDIFPSRFLSADDIEGREPKVTISHTTMEKLGDDSKLVLWFKGKEKGLVCNMTNFDRIALVHGEDTDGWVDKPLTLTTEFYAFKGKSGKAVRVKPPVTKPVRHSENPAADMDDDIPF